MQNERLRDEDRSWGMTRIEFANLEKRRIKAREKKRRQRARQRNEAGRFVANAPPLVPAIGEVFMTAHGRAYRVDGSYICGGGTAHTSITLPFVSILAT